jgi:hypothetical protein
LLQGCVSQFADHRWVEAKHLAGKSIERAELGNDLIPGCFEVTAILDHERLGIGHIDLVDRQALAVRSEGAKLVQPMIHLRRPASI